MRELVDKLINRTRNNVHESPMSNHLICNMIDEMHQLLANNSIADVNDEIELSHIATLSIVTSDDIETQLFIMTYLTLFNILKN